MSSQEIFEQYNNLEQPLFRFAFKLTRNDEDAQDLVQETAYKVILNKDKFQEGTNFKAWTYTIMKNLFINQYRKESKFKTINDTSENQFIVNNIPVLVYNEGERKIFYDELRSMVANLEDSIRVPFEMYIVGFKYIEISEHLNLPLGTIKSRIFFARKFLKKDIQKFYGSNIAKELKYTA